MTDSAESEEFAQGKALFCKGDYENAAAILQVVLKKLCSKFGDLSEESALAYFYYGRTLLQLAKQENTVMGEDVPKSQNKADADDDEDDQGDAEEEDVEEGDDSAAPLASSDAKPNEQEAKTGDQKSQVATEGTEAAKESVEHDEDASTLQLAWETLEVARVLLSKKEDSQSQIRLADVHLELGEFHLETGAFDQAVAEFRQCLEIKKKHLSADDRQLAEVLFNLGVSHQHSRQFDDAIGAYVSALQSIQQRIENISAMAASAAGPDAEQVKSEIEDLKAISNDIKEKIVDAKDEQNTHIKELLAKETATPEVAAPITAPAQVNDLSSLVRKKKPANDQDDAAAKRPKKE